jgi:hypothetical protein
MIRAVTTPGSRATLANDRDTHEGFQAVVDRDQLRIPGSPHPLGRSLCIHASIAAGVGAIPGTSRVAQTGGAAKVDGAMEA